MTDHASLCERLLGTLLAGTMVLAPVPAFASAPAAFVAPAEEAPAAAPTEVSGTVALMRITGPAPANDLRANTQAELQGKGFTVKTVALDAAGAAKKVKCRGGEMDASCLVALGKWLNKSKKTAADYIIYGEVAEDAGAKSATIVVYDIAKAATVKEYKAAITSDDYIIPLMLPRAVGSDMADHVVPPPAPTEEEQQILAELDEPEKTAEELEAEKRKIAEAESAAGQIGSSDVNLDHIVYDPKADFDEFCRKGPRKKRETKEDDIDPRPSCKRGKFWGYWQPRGWAFLVVTAAGAAATIGLYSVALAKRGPYKDAVDAVDAFESDVGGNPRNNPYLACSGDTCYADLATEVSKAGTEMRTFAIAGDVALGVTLLFAGVMGIIIHQDRKYAKDMLTQEKRLRKLSGLRMGPMVGRQGGGARLGFSF